MRKRINILSMIGPVCSLPAFLAGGILGAIMFNLGYPQAAALTLIASIVLLPAVCTLVKNCQHSFTILSRRPDCLRIKRQALTCFVFGFLLFGAMQMRLSVLPTISQPIGTLLFPSSLLFCTVQAIFMGLLGARKILLEATSNVVL